MNKYWQAKYFEKTKKESHINLFRSLEIENYLKQLLKKKSFNLHFCRLNFSNAALQIFISAYKETTRTRNSWFKTKKTKLFDEIKSNNVLKTLSNFTDNKLHIVIKVLNLNSHNNKNKTNVNLSRFRIPGIEQLYPIIVYQQDAAKLLGTFIAKYLRTTKRHNFFFNSLSKSLNVILNQSNSKIKGIKILIKGRLNNAARSRNQYIKIGTIPLITKSRSIDYSETTAFTPNGTLGIKIWISHKKILYNNKTMYKSPKTSRTNLKNF